MSYATVNYSFIYSKKGKKHLSFVRSGVAVSAEPKGQAYMVQKYMQYKDTQDRSINVIVVNKQQVQPS